MGGSNSAELIRNNATAYRMSSEFKSQQQIIYFYEKEQTNSRLIDHFGRYGLALQKSITELTAQKPDESKFYENFYNLYGGWYMTNILGSMIVKQCPIQKRDKQKQEPQQVGYTVAEYTKMLKGKDQELDVLRKKVQDQEHENGERHSKYESQLVEKEQEIKSLKAKCNGLEQKIGELQVETATIPILQKSFEQEKQNLEEVHQAQRIQLGQKIRDLEHFISKAKEDLSQGSKAISNMKEELSMRTTELLESKIAMDLSHNQIEKQLTNAQVDIEANRHEMNRLNKEKNKLIEENVELQQKTHRSSEQGKQLQEDCRKFKAENIKLKQENRQLMKECESMKLQIDSSKQAVIRVERQTDRQLTAKDNAIRDLKYDISKLNGNAEKQIQQISNLNRQNQELTSHVRDLTEYKSKSDTKMQQLSSEAERLKQRNQQLRDDLQNTDHQSNILERKRLQEEIDQLQEEVKEQKALLRLKERQNDEQSEEFHKENSQNEQIIHRQRRQISELQEKLATYE